MLLPPSFHQQSVHIHLNEFKGFAKQRLKQQDDFLQYDIARIIDFSDDRHIEPLEGGVHLPMLGYSIANLPSAPIQLSQHLRILIELAVQRLAYRLPVRTRRRQSKGEYIVLNHGLLLINVEIQHSLAVVPFLVI